MTLWPSAPEKVQVTVPPAASLTLDGLKLLSRTVTDATDGAAGWTSAVAVNSTGEPSAPATDASIVLAPSFGPRVHETDVRPLLSVVDAVALIDPPPLVTDHETV